MSGTVTISIRWRLTGRNPLNEARCTVFPTRLHHHKLCYQQVTAGSHGGNAENLSLSTNNNMANIFTLTPEQDFQYRRIQDEAPNLTADDARAMVVELSRQLMIKNNVLIDLLRRKGI